MARKLIVILVVLAALAALWFWVIRIPPPDEILVKVMQGVERVEEADVDLFFNHTTQSFRDRLPIPSDRRECKVERQKLKNQVFTNGGSFRVSFREPEVISADGEKAQLGGMLGVDFDDNGVWGGVRFKEEWPVTVLMVFEDETWKIDGIESAGFDEWLGGQSWTDY